MNNISSKLATDESLSPLHKRQMLHESMITASEEAAEELRNSRETFVPLAPNLEEKVLAGHETTKQLMEMNREQLLAYGITCSNRILQLKQEIAKSKRKVSMIVSQISDEHIITTLPFLSRWDLDAIPLVSRCFLAVYTASPLEQRRMLERFIHRWGNEHSGDSNTLCVRSEVVGRPHSDFLFDLDYTPGEYKFELSNAELSDLLQRSPLLRARTSLLWDCHAMTRDRVAAKFASLWDGCSLVLNCCAKQYNSHVVGRLPRLAPLLGGCATLLMGLNHEFGEEPANKPIEDGWEFRMDGKEETDLFGSEESGMLCCPRIEVEDYCDGIEIEHVLNYLFASAQDGKRRELMIKSYLFWPDRVKESIEKRLELVAPRIPSFSLKIISWYRLEDVPSFSFTASLPSATGGEQGQNSQHGWTLDFTVEENSWRRKKSILTVNCF